MAGFAVGDTRVRGIAFGDTVVYRPADGTPGTIVDLTATIRTGTIVLVPTTVLGTGELTWRLSPEWRQGTNDVYTQYAGAIADVEWIGTRGKIVGPKDVNSGLARIRVDARPWVTVDTYAAARTDGAVLFDTGDLADAPHRIDVEVLGVSNTSSSGTYVGLAHAEVRSTSLTAPPPTGGTADPVNPVTPGTRSMYDWPFAADSIWNTPIGDRAVYAPSGIQPTKDGVWNGVPRVTKDVIHRWDRTDDPLKPLTVGGVARGSVRVPPWHDHNGSYNGIMSYLRQDNRHVKEAQPLTLVKGGNPSAVYEYKGKYATVDAAELDLQGPGDIGMHGGSHLPGAGGVLTLKELRSTARIPHALAINLYMARFGSYEDGSVYPGGGGMGWRWPALSADRYAATGYKNGAPGMMMGTLLAIPPALFSTLKLTHERAYRIAQALRDFGGYLMDDTYWDVHALSVEDGYDEWNDVTFHVELMAAFTALRIVADNGPTNKGGAGVRLAPTAPPFIESA